MLSIYNYSSAALFLKDSWSEKQRKNPSFSIRSWAKSLGLESHASLNRIINGKRKVPKRYIPLFIKSFDLRPKEGLYLETLVDFERAKDVDQKEFYQSRLKDLAPRSSFSFKEVECFRYLKDPLHMIILEMTHLKNFSLDPKWIRKQLLIKRSLKEIDEAIDRLFSLNLLSINQDGSAKAKESHLTNIADVKDIAVQAFHKNVSNLAKESIAKQEVYEREFQGHAFAIKESSIPKAKELIRNFIKDFLEQIEATSNNGERIFQLNTQFFGLSIQQEE